MLQILIQFHAVLLQGFIVTLQLLGGAVLIGVPLGTLLGVLGGRYGSPLGAAIHQARFITKIVPVLVLLFWFHYPLQSLLGVVVNPFWTAVMTLGIINTIATADVVANELSLLPGAYREAGLTLGMQPAQIIRYIELPLLARRIAPQLLLNQAAMLEYTLLASLISVPELFRTAQTINAMIYKPVAIYSLLVVFFLAILAPLHLGITWLQKRYVTYS